MGSENQPVAFSIQQGGRDHDEVLLRVAGEMDLVSGPEISHAVREHLSIGRRVVIDLTDVTFIDSTGVGAIALLLREPTDRERITVIPSEHPQPLRLAEITGLSNLFAGAAQGGSDNAR